MQKQQIISYTSRRGDLCHNRQLGMVAGGNSGGHCHRGLVGLVAPPARIVLRGTIGWQDCFLQKPEKKKKKQKQNQQLETEKLEEIYGVPLAVVYLDVKL